MYTNSKMKHSKEESKDQESIQSSTVPDPRHHAKVTKRKKTQHTRETRDQPIPSRLSQGCNEQTRQHNR